MLPELREGLRRLCRRYDWSYAVLWQVDPRDPRLLIMEDSYCEEEQFKKIVDEMSKQVHMVGQGTIGVAALCTTQQCVYSDTYYTESSLNNHSDKLEILQDANEWQHQFLAGIQTVAIISIPSIGVLQCGATEKISESSEFMNQADHLLQQLKTVRELPHGDGSQAIDTRGKSANLACYPNYLATIYSSTNQWPNNLFVDQRHAQSGIQVLPSISPMKSSFDRHVNALYSAVSASSHPTYVFSDVVPNSRPYDTSNSCLSGVGVLLGTSHSSSPVPVLASETSSGKAYMVPSLSQELLNSHVSQDSAAVQSTSLDSKESQLLMTLDPTQQASEKTMLDPTKQPSENTMLAPMVENQPPGTCASSGVVGFDSLSGGLVENSVTSVLNSFESCYDGRGNLSNASAQLLADIDLSDLMDLDLCPSALDLEHWDAIIPGSCANVAIGIAECALESEMGSSAGGGKGSFLRSAQGELLQAEVGSINPDPGHFTLSGNTYTSSNSCFEHQTYREQVPLVGLPCMEFSASQHNLEKFMHGSSKEVPSILHGSLWIDDSCSMNVESAVTSQPKKSDDGLKVAKKRARPGESTRPRPKDRQLIQDRVKELREIVPNSARCSIDALLDRTINYMRFMQSVAKYAGKLKQIDGPKMIGEELGVILKDNSSGGSGAAWAYEVAGQTMVCPIIVEDLNPPGLMLIEMLCEERGYFLEIADIIRGFGLTILKAVMEARDHKIWARFLVEANRDLTRMDIFLSLVQLLQQTSSSRPSDQHSKDF